MQADPWRIADHDVKTAARLDIARAGERGTRVAIQIPYTGEARLAEAPQRSHESEGG